MVDRLREQRRQRGGGGVVVAGEQRPGRTTPGRRAPVRPRAAASAQRPRHLVGAGPRAAAGRSQASRGATRDGTPVPAASTSPSGRPASASSAIRRVSAAMDAGAARGPGRCGACRRRRGCRPGRAAGGLSQPGARPGRPPLGVVAARSRRRTRRSAATTGLPSSSAPVASSRGRGGDLDEERRGRLVDVQRRGGRLEVADARARRCAARPAAGAPVVEQQLDAADRLERRAGRGPVDHGRRCARTSRARAPRRPGRGSCARRAAPAPTSPGTTTMPPPRGTSSRRASSSSAGVAASSGSTVWRADAGGRLATVRRRRARAAPGPAGLSSASRTGDLVRVGAVGR